MRSAIPALVLVLVTSVAGNRAFAAGCENELLGEVALQISHGDVLIPTSIADKEVYLALRGSTGLPVVTRAGVEALGLKPTPQNGTGTIHFGNKRVTHIAKWTRIRMGNARLSDRSAVIDPTAEDAPLETVDGRPVVGSIGSSLFRYLDTELDVGAKRLKLYRPFTCRKRFPVYWDQSAVGHTMRFDEVGTLVITMELEGKDIETSLLAGDATSSIDVNATRAFFGFDESSPGIESLPIAGGGQRSLFHAMSLTGKGVDIKGAPVRLRAGTDGCKLSASVPTYHAIGYQDCIATVPFNLGLDVLSRLRVYTSRERQQLYFTPASVQR